jgi:hypothetical protein
LSPGHWINQGPGVETDGQLLFIEQGHQFVGRGMESIRVPVRVVRRHFDDEIVLVRVIQWQRQQRGSNGRIIVILGLNGRHDQVVGIVSAREKNAHQGLVIIYVGLRDRRIHEPEVANVRGQRRGANRCAGGLPQELTPGLKDGDVFVFHK